MAVQFRNLVFEGGGARGIAYIGALEVLEQRGLLAPVVRLGGTNARAIQALLVALGYRPRGAGRDPALGGLPAVPG